MNIPGAGGADEPAEVVLSVGADRVVMLFDPGHLMAHLDDFIISWQDLRDAIAGVLGGCRTRTGVIHGGFPQTTIVGVTGVVAVGPDDTPFWGFRQGRVVPSHLVVGEKVVTRELCLWGEWLAPDRFDLWTCYPGGPAPREIHDPEIGLDEIDEAIAFWSAHAIIVGP